MHKLALFGLLAFILMLPSRGEAPSAELIAHNKQIVAEAKGAGGVFVVEDSGAVRHLQSGLVCPADFPNVHLASVDVFAADGSDVGCDYARYGTDGLAVSKLTLFATRAPAGAALDDVFALYNNEVMTVHPDATPDKPATLKITDSAGKPRTDYRVAAYSLTIGGKRLHSELIVGLVNGWMLEVRASYPNAAVQVDDNTSREDIRNQAMDITSPYVAFMGAQDSLEGNSP